jgi:hypothetical protein
LAFVTVARWQGGTAVMRLLSLLAALAWAVHDILTSSAPGLLADALCIGTLIYGWRRDVATG